MKNNVLQNVIKKAKEKGSANPIMEKALEGENKELKEILLTSLKENPYQPRIEIKEEEIKDLANSIKEKGLLQPILVAKADTGYYIIAGHRRVEAHRLLGKDKIKARVIKANEEDLASLSLIENLQRENLDLIETAMALKKYKEEFGKSYEEMAKELGKSKSYVIKILNILNLPENIIKDIKENKSTKDILALNMLNSYSKKIGVNVFTDDENVDFSGVRKNNNSQKWEKEIFELYEGFLKNGREWLKKEIENRLNEEKNNEEKPLINIKLTKKHGVTIKVNKSIKKEKLGEFEKELQRLVEKYLN